MRGRKSVGFILVLLAVAVFIIGGVIWKQYSAPVEDDITVASYEECVAADYEVLETDPPQCKAPDGKVFVGPASTPLPPPVDSPDDSGLVTLTSAKGVTLFITEPTADEIISSPLTVRGKVPGPWGFEANFAIDVVDADGTVIGGGIATMLGDWMTEDLVEFEAVLEFTAPATETGTILFHRANPSDDRAQDDWTEMAVTFS